MLTITDALQFHELDGAKVVAGGGGLNKPISWVHVASGPDAPHWVNGGELVLTTDVNMPDTPDERVAYLRAMVAKGVVGLMLATGRTMDSSPEALRAAADALNFPLIEIPRHVRFVDVARAANQRIAQEPMARYERALNIHRVLTQLVLDGGDLRELAETMADLVGQSISIETDRFEALASHNIAAYDEARRYTLSEGRTDPRLVQALNERGILGEIKETLRPVHIPQMADVGLEMERILAPIVVHGEIYGYLWIIADDRPLSDLDRMAIESGSTIAALMLLHQEAVQSAEASLKGGLLSQLIQGEAARGAEREAVLTDQALRYGLDLTAPFSLLLIELPEARTNGAKTRSADRPSQRLVGVYRRVNRLAEAERWRAVVGQFAGGVVVLAQAENSAAEIAEQIHRAAGEARNQPLPRIGISLALRGASSVPAAYSQCRDALHIARRLDDPRRTVAFSDLGYLHTLYRAGDEALASNPYAAGLRLLQREQQADLFHTLEVYLDAGGNGVQTAELLCIHRSTLNYRLTRISEICGVELGDPVARTNLQVALKLLRLFEGEG
jgi:PucR family transcriptional regulator, purine catabolism regulatory protein